MGKLHELLAVEGDLKGKADKICAETINTFRNKQEHFFGIRKTYEPDSEAEKTLTHPVEVKPLVETVKDKLRFTAAQVAPYLDAVFQKELTNCHAKADLVFPDDGTAITGVPATVLLGLETKLKNLREMYDAIPTLPPGDEWKFDRDISLFRTVDKKVRTAKKERVIEIAKATDKHQAQNQLHFEDVRIGLAVTEKTAAVMTPKEKSDLLGRLDDLIGCVKQARQRANSSEVAHGEIGEQIFKFIHGGI